MSNQQKRTIFQKNFILLAIGQIVSIFGNHILRYALPLYLLNQTGSAVLFGTILAFSFIPMILLFPIGGIIADRVNKRNIMVILDFGTAILILLFYLLTGKIDIVPLMAATMIILCGIQGAYTPAVQASVPALLEPEHIVKGNSVIAMIGSLANIAGPVIGGLIFSVVGLKPILYASIGCFFASAVMEIFISIPFEKKKAAGNIFATGFGDLKESFGFMFRECPFLWKIVLVYASVNLFIVPLFLIGLPVLITQYLGFAPDTANRLYGYAQGAMGAGGILGGLLAGALSTKLKLKASPFFLIGTALFVFLLGVALQTLNGSAAYTALIIGCVLLAALAALLNIQMVSCLQLLTPMDLLGKIMSCTLCVCMCTIPLGQFIYGIVFEEIGNGVYLPFYAAAFIIMAVSIFSRRIFYGIDSLLEQKTIRLAEDIPSNG